MPKIQKLLYFLFFAATSASGQTLSMPEAIQNGVSNYGTVKAKQNYAKASAETVKQTRLDYVPNLVLSGQQSYGTINGQNGPAYGFGGYGVASSGLPLDHQNWNAAFGALYLANINWEFFTFGRYRERINLAKADVARNEADYQQELFQHEVRVAAAYLNLLASKRLVRSQQKNLDRAQIFLKTSGARVTNGLNPGVDSTLASAEVSRAKIELNRTLDLVAEQNTRLAFLMGVDVRDFELDTSLVTKVPKNVLTLETPADTVNTIRKFYRSRVDFSDQQVRLLRKNYYPSFSLFGVFQTRGSGFDSSYATNQNAFTQDYVDGITPDRQNYLVGVGVTWNLTNIWRASKQVASQKFVSEGLKNEYEVIDQQLKTQLAAAEAKIRYAMDNYVQAPKQVAAARQAYLQRTTLYKNGLTNLTDVTQALYILNRAETDSDVIYTNVWQSLLLKAAAAGDFNLFLTEFQ